MNDTGNVSIHVVTYLLLPRTLLLESVSGFNLRMFDGGCVC